MHFFFQLPKSNLGDLSYAASKNQKLRKILPKVFKEPKNIWKNNRLLSNSMSFFKKLL